MDNHVSSGRHCLPSEHQLWWQSELEGTCKELGTANMETRFSSPEPTVALREIMRILRMHR